MNQEAKERCEWREDIRGIWVTQCGNDWDSFVETPKDDGIYYCFCCGGSIAQYPYTPEMPEDRWWDKDLNRFGAYSPGREFIPGPCIDAIKAEGCEEMEEMFRKGWEAGMADKSVPARRAGERRKVGYDRRIQNSPSGVTYKRSQGERRKGDRRER